MKLFIILLIATVPHYSFAQETQILPEEKTTAKDASIDKELVRRKLRANLVEIKKCYDDEYKKDKLLEGKVNVEFIISDAGKVTSANVKSTTLNNKTVESCITNIILAIEMPAAPAGTTAQVIYPFMFQGKGK